MTYLGMSSMEALRAGTYNAAFALGMQDRIGTLEPGKFADVILVDGDPVADIQVLQDKARLKMVMKGGVKIDIDTPLPKPVTYAYEKPMLYWPDPRMGTQEFVREHARNKPRWMQAKRARAAE
jgi:adenine deaminase